MSFFQDLSSNKTCLAARLCQQQDLSSNKTCLAARLCQQQDLASNKTWLATRLGQQQDLASSKTWLAARLFQQKDLSSSKTCPAARLVQQQDMASRKTWLAARFGQQQDMASSKTWLAARLGQLQSLLLKPPLYSWLFSHSCFPHSFLFILLKMLVILGVLLSSFVIFLFLVQRLLFAVFQAACLPPYVTLCGCLCVNNQFLVQEMTTIILWRH